MDVHINDKLSIPVRALVFTASRSRGPGGQHVNKVNSRLTLHFDVKESAYLTATQKSQVMASLGTRINADGIFRLDCQMHRSQSMNRVELLDRFADLFNHALLPKRHRVATRISKAVKERRLNQKKRHGQMKKKRSSSMGMDE